MKPGCCAKQKNQRFGRFLAALAVLIVCCSAVDTSKALIGDQFWHDASTGLAIGGIDPVSYFAEAQPRHGKEELEHVWREAAFRFASTGNLEAFMRDPEVYAPRLGGYGLVAMARGVQSAGNPSLWSIVGGKLYLFHSVENKVRFEQDREAFLDNAEDQWKRLSQ